MDRNQVHRQVALMRQSLFDQGYVDEQFVQLEELQDAANPNFVEEVVTLYYRDSARLINNIEQALERSPFDYNKLDSYMHQFKGSSSSIGARKVKAECTQFREYCMAGNGEGSDHTKSNWASCPKNYSNLGTTHQTMQLLQKQVLGYLGKTTSLTCVRTFQQMKREYAALRKKLEAYFQLARQAGPRETASRSY